MKVDVSTSTEDHVLTSKEVGYNVHGSSRIMSFLEAKASEQVESLSRKYH